MGKTIQDLAIQKIISRINSINEMTTSNGAGAYNIPLSPGTKLWDKDTLKPYVEKTTKYDDAQLAYDSYDGKMDVSKNKAKKMENTARKISNYIKKHPSLSDDDGDIINPTPKSKTIREASAVDGGLYNGPVEIGMKKWKDSELGPFKEFVQTVVNKQKVKKGLKNNIKKKVGVWEKGKTGSYKIDTHPVHTIKEDLAVWFGKKKKPKGSSQPKGPWVNICRKVNGKHPPCGRPEASDKSYPKCRAAGVAGKMSDSQKRSACAQKRRAEKTHSKSGTGNAPKMVSYKPRTNESLERLIRITLKEQLSTATTYASVTPKSSGTFNCVPSSVKPLVEYVKKNKNNIMSKLGVDNSKLIMFLKAAIGIIGRESSFENSIRYDLKKIAVMFGLGDSYGPAQMTKKTWDELDINKKFNLSDDSLFEVVGAGLAAMLYLKNAYDKAISVGYTSDKTTNIEGTGNSALDISIGSYNAGTDKIVKYCKSPNDKLAHVCKSGEKSFVVNYLPNFSSDKVYTGELTTHGYVKEVASYYKTYNCLNSI